MLLEDADRRSLANQLRAVFDRLGSLDAIIIFDTGGDILSDVNSGVPLGLSDEQDHRVLDAVLRAAQVNNRRW